MFPHNPEMHLAVMRQKNEEAVRNAERQRLAAQGRRRPGLVRRALRALRRSLSDTGTVSYGLAGEPLREEDS
jgi:hypothetical protein